MIFKKDQSDLNHNFNKLDLNRHTLTVAFRKVLKSFIQLFNAYYVSAQMLNMLTINAQHVCIYCQ